MKLKSVKLRNFRRFENAFIQLEGEETVCVGPNNSGKTSVAAAFRLFLGGQSFKIYDFSVSCIPEIDAVAHLGEDAEKLLPTIEMDLWFSIDPDKIAYGRVSDLIYDVSFEHPIVGIRLTYGVKNVDKLLDAYYRNYPETDKAKSLSYYLSLSGNLGRYYELSYSALNMVYNVINDEEASNEESFLLESSGGKRVLQSLLRVDFVDAQRNIDDYEDARSSRLSSAFVTFYKKNLEQASVSEEANRVIDENNQRLTDHYELSFADLMRIIGGLGVPSITDREIKIASTLSPETILQGNTSLLYIDNELNHELPEAYNGLGFKNLVYMAIQISHFHIQWMRTEVNRPLCQLIFIEEPEVHLHAQVQQTFIANIWKIVKEAASVDEETDLVPQLLITTHSSHILDTVDFGKARYFRRCAHKGKDVATAVKLHASEVLNLRDFSLGVKNEANDESKKLKTEKVTSPEEVINFLKKYLKLTHCDLFFADAAILVEGTAEKLLLPTMIEKCAPKLQKKYLTILEVGGAYAHRLASLLKFIGIPYLIITDLDSIDYDPDDPRPETEKRRKDCRADRPNAYTSNACLRHFLDKDLVSEITSIASEEHILEDRVGYITFQKPTLVEGYSPPAMMTGRTFEEAFVYQNIQLFRNKFLDLGIDWSSDLDFESEYQAVYERVKSKSFKKTEFALDIAMAECSWATPTYIKNGLCWLVEKISVTPKAD